MFLFLAFKADVVEGGATIGTTALVCWQLHSSLYTYSTGSVQGYWSTPDWSDRRPGGEDRCPQCLSFGHLEPISFQPKLPFIAGLNEAQNVYFHVFVHVLKACHHWPMTWIQVDYSIPYLYSVPRTCDNRIFLFERITFNAFFSLLPTINLQCLPYFSATL
jgi:hypothetical protein